MESIIYLSIILILLFIILELYRWNIVYRGINKLLQKQNSDLVGTHAKLSNEFVDQFKKYNEQSIENNERIDRYTKMYDSFLIMYKNHLKNNS